LSFMRKVMLFFMVVVIVFGMVAFASPTEDLSVTVDGRRVVFQDQDPIIIDGRTLVPVRGVFESLGFNVSWNDVTRTVIIQNADYFISIPIGSYTFTTNGATYWLDVPAQIFNGRTLIPRDHRGRTCWIDFRNFHPDFHFHFRYVKQGNRPPVPRLGLQ